MYHPDQMFGPFLDHQERNRDVEQAEQIMKRVIDVYVMDYTCDDNEENNAQDMPSLTVESTLTSIEDEPLNNTTASSTEPIAYASLPQHHPFLRNGYVLLTVLAVTGLLLGTRAFVLVSLFPPAVSASATVMLLTASRPMITQVTLTLTNGTHSPDTAGTLIKGRLLDTVTLRQTRTIATTGLTHQNARAASGFLTFYNAAPYPQVVRVGTEVMGTDGILVVTDQGATIPPALLPTEGQVSVPAHAIMTGPRGNIHARDIYEACCQPDVFVANTAFYGGHDAYIYQSISAQDVSSTATKLLTTGLIPAIQAMMQTEVHLDETLLTPIACTPPHVSSDQPIGTEATQVKVAVEETCQGAVYNTHEFQQALTQSVTHDAQQQMGMNYGLEGAIQTSILDSSTLNENGSQNVKLSVLCKSVWIYQINEAQQQRLKEMLVGKNENEAIVQMLQEPGVRAVSISLTHSTKLPQNSKDSTVVIINPT